MPFLSVQSVWIRVLGKNLLSITFLFYSLNADIRKMRNVLEKITKYNEAWTQFPLKFASDTLFL